MVNKNLDVKEQMKIFKISQNVNSDYDTFSDAIVIAKDKEDAKRIHPYSYNGFKDIFFDEKRKQFWNKYSKSKESYLFEDRYGTWTNNLTKIKVELIGIANSKLKRGVVCASFHAG